MKFLITTLIALTLSQVAVAELPTVMQEHLLFGQPSVELVRDLQIEDDYALLTKLGQCNKLSSHNHIKPSVGLDSIIQIDRIINLGQKVWNIIKAGEPIVKLSRVSANALPYGVSCWNELESWQRPVSKVYRVRYKNGFGATAVSFDYKVVYTYGGSHKGQGRYLTNVAVLPSNVTALWGYEVNANVTVDEVINLGTSLNPMAGMGFSLEWQVKTVMKEGQSSVSFFVSGDGQLDLL